MAIDKANTKKQASETALLFFLMLFLVISLPHLDAAKEDPKAKQVNLKDFSENLFYEPFDSNKTIDSNGGTYSQISFTPGKKGNATLIGSGSSLSYPIEGNLNITQGTIDFWFRPNWDGDDAKSHSFFEWKQGTARFRIFKYYSATSGKNYFVFRIDDSSGLWREASSSPDEPGVVTQWKAGEWHHVTALWNFSDGYAAYLLDGYPASVRFDWNISDEPTEFYIGSTASGIWEADCLFDELKILNRSIIKNETDMNIESYKDYWRDDGECQDFETANYTTDCNILNETFMPNKSLMFFKTKPFETIFYKDIPKEDDITNEINYTAAKNQHETLFFGIYSRVNLESNISVSSFTSRGGMIKADLRVVKNWFQAGRGTTKTLIPVYVPELLLHDDTIDLEQGWNSTNLPSLPLLDHVHTRLNKFTSKQFAIIVNISNRTPAGIYLANITIQNHTELLRINLEVLPFSLKESDRKNLVYFESKIGYPDDYIDAVNEETFIKQANDIKEHGFNGACLYGEPSISMYERKFNISRDAGLDGMLFFLSHSIEQRDIMINNGYEPYFYGRDEPNDMDTMVDGHIPISIEIHSMGGKVITAISKTWADKLKDPDDLSMIHSLMAHMSLLIS